MAISVFLPYPASAPPDQDIPDSPGDIELLLPIPVEDPRPRQINERGGGFLGHLVLNSTQTKESH